MMTRLTVCFVLLTFGVVPVARASLIASWSGEDNIAGQAVESVASRHGTPVNGAGFGSGRFGQGFSLDGVNDYVSVPDDNVWALGSDFTIALWANFDVVKSETLGQLPNVFIGQSEGPGSREKWVFFYDDDGELAFHRNDTSANSVFLTSTTTFFPTIGTWHHFALTRTGITYEFFADGSSLGAVTSGLTVPNADFPLTIGQAEGLGYFNGRLDEVQIYSNALSEPEIAQLHAIPEPSTLAIWTIGALAVFGYGRRCRKRAA